jgi:hypothetical protein
MAGRGLTNDGVARWRTEAGSGYSHSDAAVTAQARSACDASDPYGRLCCCSRRRIGARTGRDVRQVRRICRRARLVPGRAPHCWGPPGPRRQRARRARACFFRVAIPAPSPCRFVGDGLGRRWLRRLRCGLRPGPASLPGRCRPDGRRRAHSRARHLRDAPSAGLPFGQPDGSVRIRRGTKDHHRAVLARLEHFQEKWKPVFRPKMRQTQQNESTFSFLRN